jgi:hypothetical protein
MKTFFIFLIGGLMILLSIVIGIGVASGAEVPPAQEPKQEFVECDYKPSDSDRNYTVCSYVDKSTGQKKELHGEGYLSLTLCGQTFSVDIKCP